jgi:hypothetical protein
MLLRSSWGRAEAFGGGFASTGGVRCHLTLETVDSADPEAASLRIPKLPLAVRSRPISRRVLSLKLCTGDDPSMCGLVAMGRHPNCFTTIGPITFQLRVHRRRARRVAVAVTLTQGAVPSAMTTP